MNTATVYQVMLQEWKHTNSQSLVNKLQSSFHNFITSYHKLKLRVFSAGHIVVMVTNCATKFTATCLPMIGQFFDTMIFASTDKEWL